MTGRVFEQVIIKLVTDRGVPILLTEADSRVQHSIQYSLKSNSEAISTPWDDNINDVFIIARPKDESFCESLITNVTRGWVNVI